MTKYIRHVLVLVTAVLAAACTMTDTSAPPLAGPSEMSLSLAITANPDVLSLDGSSQTLITRRGARQNGQPGAESCRSASKFSRMASLSTSARSRRARS